MVSVFVLKVIVNSAGRRFEERSDENRRPLSQRSIV